jgi:hypothetical protein
VDELNISLYFTAEWWDLHFHVDHPRPDRRTESALEAMYLGRNRFLFEQFGQCEIGSEHPALDSGQIATVIRYGFDLIPALLGTRLDYADAWGFYPRFRELVDVGQLSAVDIARTAEGAWITKEKDRLTTRYGDSSHCIDMGSVANNAFRIIGQEVYTEALSNPRDLSKLFEVILETERHLHSFLSELFGLQDPVPISNCNVSLFGPATYERVVLPFDRRQARFAADLAGVPARACLHHCDVIADAFLDAYATMPELEVLQASFESDIALSHNVMHDLSFSALVSPGALNGNLKRLRKGVRRALRDGVNDFAVWNVDADTAPDQIRNVLSLLCSAANDAGREPRATAMPLCWEELEWAHGRYQ